MKAFLTIRIGPNTIGNLNLDLYEKDTPKTCHNFIRLLGDKNQSELKNQACYKYSNFHRIIPGFMIQGGDYEFGNGTGGKSIYKYNADGSFPDENFINSHNARGMLSMANSGPNTNGSQFFITFQAKPHLDGKHVVFGKVDMDCDESRKVLNLLEKVPTIKKGMQSDVPKFPVTIVDCGVLKNMDEDEKKIEEIKQDETDVYQPDEDEIDLDDEDDDEHKIDETENENKTKVDTKPLNPLQQRLQKLRMKMNQSKILNRREILTEGERITSEEGMSKERKRLYMEDKKRRDKEWESCHGKAISNASNDKNHVKSMVELASDNMKKTMKKTIKAERNRFDVNDYYNPEGQHRNYERSLKSIVHTNNYDNNNDIDDVTDASNIYKGSNTTHTMGAKRLANELKRRAAKSKALKKKKQRLEFESTDINYVDKRNKRFNEKISRNYDTHTAEIRQNLERGTAL